MRINRLVILGALIFLPFQVMAEQYVSLNKMCVAEKQGEDYLFLNSRELKSKLPEVLNKNTRDRFQWFFLEGDMIQAKVHEALRDASIDSPAELYKQPFKACPLTDVNQKLARTVPYTYVSKDSVCACIRDGNQINCRISGVELQNTPPERWMLFFDTGGMMSNILQRVPEQLEKWIPVKSGYKQKIHLCRISGTEDETFMREYEITWRKQQQ